MASSEHNFLRYVARGDSRALGKVFDQTAPEILSIARYLVRNAEQAQDVLQDTFLTAIEQAHRFDADQQIVPWLLGIAANHARRITHARRTSSNDQNEQVDPALSPIDVAAARELEQALEQALQGLPTPYAQVLNLHLREGLEPIEIADQLERSPDTVRSQIRRGLDQLRRALPIGTTTIIATEVCTAQVNLSAVRTAVLANASVSASATSVALLTKVAVALLLCLGSALWWAIKDTDQANSSNSSAIISEVILDTVPPNLDQESAASNRVSIGNRAENLGPGVRILDAATGKPMANVQVAVEEHPLALMLTGKAPSREIALQGRSQTGPLQGQISASGRIARFRRILRQGSHRGQTDKSGIWRMPTTDEPTIRLIVAGNAEGHMNVMTMMPPELAKRMSDRLGHAPAVAQDSTKIFDLELGPQSSVAVLVVDSSGTPVANTPIALQAEGGLNIPAREITGEDGIAQFTHLQLLMATSLTGSTWHTAIDVVGAAIIRSRSFALDDPPQKPIRLTLPSKELGSLRILVVDQHGQPHRDAMTFALHLTADHEKSKHGVVPQGEITFTHLALGQAFTISASSLGRELVSATQQVPPLTTREPSRLITLEIDSNRVPIVRGRAVDQNGSPLAGRLARLSIATHENDETRALYTSSWFNTGSDGSIEESIRNLPAFSQIQKARIDLLIAPTDKDVARLATLNIDKAKSSKFALGDIRCFVTTPASAGRVVNDQSHGVPEAQVIARFPTAERDTDLQTGSTEGAHTMTKERYEAALQQLRANPQPIVATPSPHAAPLLPFRRRPQALSLTQVLLHGSLQVGRQLAANTSIDANRQLQPAAFVVTRHEGYFDVYTSARVSHIALSARMQRSRGAEAIAVFGDQSVSLVVGPQHLLIGTLVLPEDLPKGVLIADAIVSAHGADGTQLGSSTIRLQRSSSRFTISGLPDLALDLRVTIKGETTPALQVSGIRPARESQRDTPGLEALQLPARALRLDFLDMPRGANTWIHYKPETGPEPIIFDGYDFDSLDSPAILLLSSRTATLEVNIRVQGCLDQTLRNIQGYTTVLLSPGYAVEVQTSIQTGFAALSIGTRTERAAIKSGYARFTLPMTGTYQIDYTRAQTGIVPWVRPARAEIEVKQSDDLQRFDTRH